MEKILSIDNLKKILFYDKEYLVPSNSEEYLTVAYGKDWKIPKKYGYNKGIRKMYTNII